MGTKPFWRTWPWFLGSLGFFFDSFDVFIFSYVLPAVASEWALNPREQGWLISSGFIGMAVGAFVAGLLADRYGRRLIFLATMLLYSLGTGVSALATGLWVMVLLRFIVGLGLGGEMPIASTYVSESVQVHERGRAVVLADSFWALGSLVAAMAGRAFVPTLGWRETLLIAAFPAVAALAIRRSLPESKQFAVARREERVAFRKLFAPEARRATLVLWTLWVTVNFAYYGMFLWLPSLMLERGFTLVKSFEYVLLMTLAQLPGLISAAWLVERLGRRFVLAVYLLGTAVAAYGFGHATATTWLLIFGAWLNFFNLGAWGALYAYTPELYPTALRARGAGAAGAMGRVAAIVSPSVVGILLANGVSQATVFSLFFVVLFVGVGAVTLFGPETKPSLAGEVSVAR
ncbi:MAG TPA: MFS transporter [Thermaerobacter sp.]